MAKTAGRKRTGEKEVARPRKSNGARTRARSDRSSATARSAGRAVATETLRQQADRLGLLDPLDAEPATVYAPDGGDR
jgi:hypothetical protein